MCHRCYCLSNTSQVAFYDWSMAINYLKVLTDVTTTSNSPHVLDTFNKFSGFVCNVCCVDISVHGRRSSERQRSFYPKKTLPMRHASHYEHAKESHEGQHSPREHILRNVRAFTFYLDFGHATGVKKPKTGSNSCPLRRANKLKTSKRF